MDHSRWACVAALSLVLLASGPVARAGAGPPTETLRRHLEELIATVDDDVFAAEPLDARRAAIRRIADRLFDWAGMARRALGRHWAARNARERAHFVALFERLVERGYLSLFERPHDSAGDRLASMFRYVGEVDEGDRATVRAVMAQGKGLPVDFLMLRERGQWRVEDVVIGGVSLVANYRAQIDEILRRSSYEELARTMAAKGQGTPVPRARGGRQAG